MLGCENFNRKGMLLRNKSSRDAVSGQYWINRLWHEFSRRGFCAETSVVDTSLERTFQRSPFKEPHPISLHNLNNYMSIGVDTNNFDEYPNST